MKVIVVGEDYVIVLVPMNYYKNTNSFDTSSIEAVISAVIRA
jgi:hypothetical protein